MVDIPKSEENELRDENARLRKALQDCEETPALAAGIARKALDPDSFPDPPVIPGEVEVKGYRVR